MIKVRISLTHRAVPFEITIEASDKTDINYLLTEELGTIIEAIQKFIDNEIKKAE